MDSLPKRGPNVNRLLGLVAGSWKSQAVYAAARLRLADLLADGPRDIEHLAAAAGAHAPSLARLLRALVTIEVVRQLEDGAFEITSMGELLGTNAPDSVRSWVLHWGASSLVWGHLHESVISGRSARSLLFGTTGFEHLERDHEAAMTFHGAMVELTRLVARDFIRAVEWTRAEKIVDVGGGSGELLTAVLTAASDSVGVLYDTAEAIELGRLHLRAADLEHRCEFVAGDFFEWVPGGADTYILKSVLHDWNDDDAARILASCRRAIAPSGRLIVVERILPERMGSSTGDQVAACSDLHMLVQLGGRERTEAELVGLLAAGGFETESIRALSSALSVVEAIPRDTVVA